MISVYRLLASNRVIAQFLVELDNLTKATILSHSLPEKGVAYRRQWATNVVISHH